MSAPFGIVSIIGVSYHSGIYVVNILESHFNLNIINLLFNIKNTFVYRLLEFIVKTNERTQSPLKTKSHGWRFNSKPPNVKRSLRIKTLVKITQIKNAYPKTFDQVGLTAEMRNDFVPVKFNLGKNFLIGFKSDY